MVQTQFETELEIFRTEEETAQQYFFSYLSVRSLAAKNTAVLAAMNTTPLFWITTHHAMLLSAIVALGRIFDQRSKHNIDRLMSIASGDLTVFSKAALAARKESAGLTKQQASEGLHPDDGCAAFVGLGEVRDVSVDHARGDGVDADRLKTQSETRGFGSEISGAGDGQSGGWL